MTLPPSSTTKMQPLVVGQNVSKFCYLRCQKRAKIARFDAFSCPMRTWR